MTTTTPEGAPDTGGALDPFRELYQLLPKLVQPSWYKHVHSGMYHENRHRHEKHQEPESPAVQKAKRREQRKQTRFARALAGEHTRAARAA